MVEELLVTQHVDDGRRLIQSLVAEGLEVSAAFWARIAEKTSWELYICLASLNAQTEGECYRRAYLAQSQIPLPSFGLAEINLLASDNPAAIEAIQLRGRYAGKILTWPWTKPLGNLRVEEVYFYPPGVGQLTRDELLQAAVLRIGEPSTVKLHSGSTMQGVPSSIDSLNGKVRVWLLDQNTNSTQPFFFDDIATIQ